MKNLNEKQIDDHQHLLDATDYSRIQRIEKARLAAHYAVEQEINKRLTVILITNIAASILIVLGVILLFVACVHLIWG